MDRLIYLSAAAMRGSMVRQTAIANNLANAETPGFRADLSTAEARWLSGQPLASRVSMAGGVKAADMRAGAVETTGRALDVALEGDALLTVQSEEGEETYSRRGDLQLSDTGLLTTGDGRPVIGGGGPITLPPADSITIDPQGRILVVPQGGDATQPQEVDRLRLVSATGSAIVKGVDNLFRVDGGGALPEDPDARLKSGALERSNVQPTEALVAMIEASRQWDTQLKLIADARDNDAATAALMRLE